MTIYLLKYGEYPFGHDAYGKPLTCLDQNSQNILPGYDKFLSDPQDPYPQVSFEDLFCKMVKFDSHERPSAEECLAHPWFYNAVLSHEV